MKNTPIYKYNHIFLSLMQVGLIMVTACTWSICPGLPLATGQQCRISSLPIGWKHFKLQKYCPIQRQVLLVRHEHQAYQPLIKNDSAVNTKPTGIRINGKYTVVKNKKKQP
jgi:hypothetical protein